MGRIRLFVVAIVGGVAITALSIPAADAKTFCPPSPAPGSSISGGLVVTGPTDCVLDNVAVSGGILVTSPSTPSGNCLEILNDSFISGGIVVQSGAELDVGHTCTSNTPLPGTSATISGGVKASNPLDIDVYNAEVTGGILVDGVGAGFFPTVCGSTISGGLTFKHIVNSGGFIGDPNANNNFPASCSGNFIDTSVFVIDSPALVEIEKNTISGSVNLSNSKVEVGGNTIGGSLQCVNTVFTIGEAGPNTVHGSTTCP
jgi:hypothetical protein